MIRMAALTHHCELNAASMFFLFYIAEVIMKKKSFQFLYK